MTVAHSITSSASASNLSGILRPSALAVVKLMTRSNLVGCSTGMSPGFAPRRIALMAYSKTEKPVALPPGRPRLRVLVHQTLTHDTTNEPISASLIVDAKCRAFIVSLARRGPAVAPAGFANSRALFSLKSSRSDLKTLSPLDSRVPRTIPAFGDFCLAERAVAALLPRWVPIGDRFDAW
jgi:hypothetical protein